MFILIRIAQLCQRCNSFHGHSAGHWHKLVCMPAPSLLTDPSEENDEGPGVTSESRGCPEKAKQGVSLKLRLNQICFICYVLDQRARTHRQLDV